MSTISIESKVREIVAQQLGIGEEEIQPTSSFPADLGIDALDFIELIMALEEEFGLDIDDEEAGRFKAVQDVVDYLTGRTSQ